MPEVEYDYSEKGTLFFKKVKTRQVTFEAIVMSIEARVDKNNRPFTTILLQPLGEKAAKWNCFDSEQARFIKSKTMVLVHGTYFGPFKKRIDQTEVIKTLGGKK